MNIIMSTSTFPASPSTELELMSVRSALQYPVDPVEKFVIELVREL